MSEVRVRFAPSPTGYLHVGGARTALFNWMFARHHKGKFFLRIEDTDRQRSTPEAVEAIFSGLRWLELGWDEEPLFQSRRLEAHQELVQTLLDRGAAYHCFCDPETLAAEQKAAEKRGEYYRYPGTCRKLSADDVAGKLAAGQSHAVRFKVPEGQTYFRDAVYGDVTVQHGEVEDFILLRRDGTPVYQVAVVADDIHMGVTHIIRGDDHLSNTPKQILLYKALDLPVPQFAHVPLILGPDKKRLSKRHGATSVTEYRQRGILAAAMRNFLALLGWSPGDDREIMSLNELIEAFNLERINPSGAVFDETKLLWMNGKYISSLSDQEVWDNIRPLLQPLCQYASAAPPDDALGLRLAELFRERLRTFAEAPDMLAYFICEPTSWDEKGVRKFWKEDTPGRLSVLFQEFEALEVWDRATIEAVFERIADQQEVNRSKLIHPVRLALTGRTATPGIFEVMELLGREVCLERLKRAIEAGPV